MSASSTTSSPTQTVSQVADAPTPNPQAETELFDRPAVIGGFNPTPGVFIYSAFLFVFVVAVGIATTHRLMVRRAAKKQQEAEKASAAEEGRANGPGDGPVISTLNEKRAIEDDDKENRAPKRSNSGDGDKSHKSLRDIKGETNLRANLFKQVSLSKVPLMEDVGPAGSLPSADASAKAPGHVQTDGELHQSPSMRRAKRQMPTPEANPPMQQSLPHVSSKATKIRRNGSQASTTSTSSTSSTSGSRRERTSARAYGRGDDVDTTDYTRPPLTASTFDDAYYSTILEPYRRIVTPPPLPQPAYKQQQQSRREQRLSQQQHELEQQPKPTPRVMSIHRSASTRIPANNIEPLSIPKTNKTAVTAASRGVTRTGSHPRIETPMMEGLEDAIFGSSPRSSIIDVSNNGPVLARSASESVGYTGADPGSPTSGRLRGTPLSPSRMHPLPIKRSMSTRLPVEMRGPSATAPNNYSYM
ncbi:hypothetical protein BGW38_006521 [Lunasporangiospora selenospora]|uniref:Uncharacterized protein n=1 Tax=Lunasporangiospora selenospora TaxID=979761 RepID=A0A9P6FLQ3_9FUNG|nr:hypothetical protein BGW38_006521 [Lunasporangiospora selenospora]